MSLHSARLESSSTGSSFPADSAKPVPLAIWVRPLSRGEPIPGRPALHKEKRTLPGAPAGFSGIGRVTALDASRRPSPPLRIRGSEPDSLSIGRGQRRPSPVPSERRSPIS
uniref:Uncharacterized protein n=1 Tax=Sphenodon punctatus TaxID=8508 RepID=A0A8D0H473_SPHPU